jgi:proline iminopeptidase
MSRHFIPLLLCMTTALFCYEQNDKTLLDRSSGKHIRTSDGVDLYVTVKGKGTSCLYVHGGPGSGSYWMEKFSGEMLEQHFQMIYLDQRGSARSSSPKDKNYAMDRMVRDFEEVRTALEIKQWVTLGHSFGGILQMGYIQRHPQTVIGMIMLNCSLNAKESTKESIPKACELLNITDISPYTDESIPLFERLNKLYGELRKQDLWWKMGYASHKSYDIMSASFEEVQNFNNDLSNIIMPEEYLVDFKKAVANVKIPVLFFYGKTDWMVGPNHFKGVSFPEMILWGSDVGHVASLENQGDLEKAITSYQTKYKF